jgi:hypothetical protein
MPTSSDKKRQPPIRIPLPFETAVGGLPAVDPKGPRKPGKKPAKKGNKKRDR